MKFFVPFALLTAVGLILAAGCVAMVNKNTTNATTAAGSDPVPSISDPGLNETIIPTANSTPDLKGSLRVSIGGILYPAVLSVVLDNETVGTVKPDAPLYLRVSEGNHTVTVCLNSVCEQENITTKFGTYVTIDFSERIQRDVEFPNPTARPTAHILDYYKNGDVVSVYVEFVNPESIDHTISADLSFGYTYIDSRSHIKLGDSAHARTTVFVNAGQKETNRVDMYLPGSDASICFSNPVIEELQIK